MCFVFIWEQRVTCATYNRNWLVFITEMKSVYCAVRTGSLNKAVCASSLKGQASRMIRLVSRCKWEVSLTLRLIEPPICVGYGSIWTLWRGEIPLVLAGNRIHIPWSSSPRSSHYIDWAVWVYFRPIIGVSIYECFWSSVLQSR